jgi:hypothetical protein
MIYNQYVTNYNNHKLINYEKEADDNTYYENDNNFYNVTYNQNEDENDDENENEYEDDENENQDIEIYYPENQSKIGKFMSKEFSPGGGRYPGIWAIEFIPATSTAIYRYGNAYTFLPISSSLVYTGTVNTGVPGYVFSNIFQGTSSQVTGYTTGYGELVGQSENDINPIRFNGIIYTIVRDPSNSNNIYFGGNFFIGNGVDVDIRCLAKWDRVTNTWSKVNDFFIPNPNESVYSIEIVDSIIYVGGDFTQVQTPSYTINVSSFVAWDSQLNIWTNGPGGIELYNSSERPGAIYTMKASRGFLYIGGDIFKIKVGGNDILDINNIFRLNANRFSNWLNPDRLGRGVSNKVYAIDSDSAGNIYVGGSFGTAYNRTSDLRVNFIARWNYNSNFSRSTWLQIKQGRSTIGVNNDVYAIAVTPTNRNVIWFGGLFFNSRFAGTYVASFNWSSKRWARRSFKKTNPGT